MRTKFTLLTDSHWKSIEKILTDKRKRKYSLRTIFNAILWICRTGSQWRNLSSDFPYWQIVYYYFNKWKKAGVLEQVMLKMVRKERIDQGRNYAPSVSAIDSQSIKKTGFVSIETGIDGGKHINGRKRHLAVDSLGLPIAISVSGANIHDSIGGFDLLWKIEKVSHRMKLIRTDKAYQGEFSDMVENYYKWKMEIAQKPPTVKGFVPQKGRWQVERSFAWLNNFRRLSKDYERLPESSVAFIQVAFISILLK
ncbi:IS5 family transposase [Chitinophaga sancti]|uniref:IS5 family transposase n=9 Tax=Chitinophaga sancti TaxID=1004 RepID=A0ABZ0XPJ5_9BACT|nr:IS5 family transposase [Chitinophaga sancti]WQD62298.1 IS5 family transposase [Chitinophaga sancti]WQD62461.1 IS5 family transposase [Chitinophaga sancti]WQD62662.1 IS5 family transposase [Chitinophaga sancti]WQG86852.1 IS5 family transposase [Chitinophaga sancti]WQG91714.1 IS5 family transposase [Chitinophaga sancti]